MMESLLFAAVTLPVSGVGKAPAVAECYLGRRGWQIGLALEWRGFRGIGLIDKLAPVGQICCGLCCTLLSSLGPRWEE